MIVIDAACDQEVTPQLDNGAWNNKMPLNACKFAFTTQMINLYI